MKKGWMTFEEWKGAVDNCLRARVGMTSEDLPDVDYRGMYDRGDTASHAAAYAITNGLS